jgi:hypothetical protein
MHFGLQFAGGYQRKDKNQWMGFATGGFTPGDRFIFIVFFSTV